MSSKMNNEFGIYTQNWNEMPRTATFDELLAAPGFHNFVEKFGIWKIILKNGSYYTMDRDDHEIGTLCAPLQMIDKNSLANFGR